MKQRLGFLIKVIVLFAAFGLISGCAGGPGNDSASTPFSRSERASQRLSARLGARLVFIGLDGWGGAFVSGADMPAVKRMIRGGSSTLNAMNVLPTNSWPNWSSLFSGAPPELRTKEGFPSIFSVFAGQRPEDRAVFFYEWGPLENICDDKAVDRRGDLKSNEESARMVAAHIREHKPFFTAVVFDQPDGTGHGHRWGSPEYYAKLAELDGFIALIEEGVRDAGVYDSTVFILSSDHGGILWGHGFNTPAQRKIPLVIYGGGVKGGFTIPSPVSICDIAPTMAAVLGLEAPPEWTGRILWEVFE